MPIDPFASLARNPGRPTPESRLASTTGLAARGETNAMRLDPKVLRLAESLESEIQRVLDKHRARIAGFDDAAYDEKNSRVTFRRGDEIIYNGIAEEIG